MDAEPGLLGSDVAGQRHLREQSRSLLAFAGVALTGVALACVHGEKAGEGWAELDPPGGEPLAQLLTGNPVGVRSQQFGEVLARRTAVRVGSSQGCRRVPDAFPVDVGLHGEFCCTRGPYGRGGGDFGVLIEQHQLLELDIPHLATESEAASEDQSRCSQGHFAVGSTRIGSHVVDLVVGQPRQLCGADVVLPDVALRLLGQPHMLAEQGVHRRGARTAQLLFCGRGFEEEVAVSPRRQRCVEEVAARIQGGEIDRGAGAV